MFFFPVWKGPWCQWTASNASWALFLPAPVPARSHFRVGPCLHILTWQSSQELQLGPWKESCAYTIAMDKIQWSPHIQTSSRYLHVFCKGSGLAAPRALYFNFEVTIRTYDTSFMTICDNYTINQNNSFSSHGHAIERARTHTQKDTYESYVWIDVYNCIHIYYDYLRFISPRKRSEALRSSVCNSLPNLPKYYAGDGKWLFNIQLHSLFSTPSQCESGVHSWCKNPSPNILFFLLGSAVCIVHWLMRTSTMFDIIRLLCASAFTESHRKKALAKQQSLVSSSGMS